MFFNGKRAHQRKFSGVSSFAILRGTLLASLACGWCAPAWATPTFTEQTIENTGRWRLCVGDMNRDGYLDIVVCDQAGECAWWENNGSGSFLTKHVAVASTWQSGTAFVKDMDGDGDLDIIGGVQNIAGNYVAWYENNGSGGGWVLHTVDTINTGFIWWAEPADIDNDGDMDIAVAQRDKILWEENTGGSFTPHVLSTSTYDAGFAHPISLNYGGGGTLSIVGCSHYMGMVTVYSADGSSSSTLDYGGSGGWAACSFDANGDGYQDLVVADYSRVKYYAGSNGGLSLSMTDTDGGGYGCAAADLDGDGDIDFVACGFPAWYENNGSGSWTKHSISTGILATSLATGDVNGDGKIDIPFNLSPQNGNKIGWYKNN
jgi:hypothetical protein